MSILKSNGCIKFLITPLPSFLVRTTTGWLGGPSPTLVYAATVMLYSVLISKSSNTTDGLYVLTVFCMGLPLVWGVYITLYPCITPRRWCTGTGCQVTMITPGLLRMACTFSGGKVGATTEKINRLIIQLWIINNNICMIFTIIHVHMLHILT